MPNSPRSQEERYESFATGGGTVTANTEADGYMDQGEVMP